MAKALFLVLKKALFLVLKKALFLELLAVQNLTLQLCTLPLLGFSCARWTRINVCFSSLNFLNTHQPVRDCIYESNKISVKKYICWSNTTLVIYCMYLLVLYNLSHKIHLLVKYNLGQILYVFIGHIQLRSEIIFIGQIQPWSS